jgi:hypothetical protein
MVWHSLHTPLTAAKAGEENTTKAAIPIQIINVLFIL